MRNKFNREKKICFGKTEMENADQSTSRPQFGNRFLNENEDVFQHNAWYVKKIV